jgi:hypothetical protein
MPFDKKFLPLIWATAWLLGLTLGACDRRVQSSSPNPPTEERRPQDPAAREVPASQMPGRVAAIMTNVSIESEPSGAVVEVGSKLCERRRPARNKVGVTPIKVTLADSDVATCAYVETAIHQIFVNFSKAGDVPSTTLVSSCTTPDGKLIVGKTCPDIHLELFNIPKGSAKSVDLALDLTFGCSMVFGGSQTQCEFQVTETMGCSVRLRHASTRNADYAAFDRS